MRKTIIFFVLALFCTNGILAQNTSPQEQMEEDLKQLEESFDGLIGEFFSAFEQAQEQLKESDLESLGDGWMRIEGDSLNLGQFYRMIPDMFKKLPKGMQPSEEWLENQDEISKQIPDLLEKSKELFQSDTFKDLEKKLYQFEYPNGTKPAPAPRKNDKQLKKKKDPRMKDKRVYSL